jgi:hypothetical protein
LKFIKPELLVLIPVLYAIGVWFKNSSVIKDWKIPFILTGVSVFLTALYLLGTEFPAVGSLVAAYIFTAIVQGVLCAAGAVFVQNISKQLTVGRESDISGTAAE